MRRRFLIGTLVLACTGLLAVAKLQQPEPLEFALGGRTAFVMRQLLPDPDGATDFRILGSTNAPAILSLIGPEQHRYADYTYNGSDADIDVSHGGLNLRPIDGQSSVNIWSMRGNTKLKVGNRDFREAVALWHDGTVGYIQSSSGEIIVQSSLQVEGGIRTRLLTPTSSSSACTAGQILWDSDYIYVCTATSVWKRAPLASY